MKQLFSMLCFLTLPLFLMAQNNYWSKPSPYQLQWKKDVPIGVTAAGLFYLGINAVNSEPIPNFEPGSFNQADIDAINFLDRSTAGRWDIKAKDAGKIFKFTGRRLVPIGVLALPGNLKSRATMGLMYFEGRYIAGGLVALAKGKTNRYRPYTYLNATQIEALEGEAKEEFLEDIADDDIEDSFFSGDATSTAYGLIFFAKVYSDYFPDSKWKKGIWALSITGTTLGAYFRTRSGKHFPTDVIVGSIVGGGLGYLIPHLHKKQEGKALSINPSNNGLSLVYQFGKNIKR